MEAIVDGAYVRNVEGGGFRITEQGGVLAVETWGTVPDVAGRVRAMFDLDADLPAIESRLAEDPTMAAFISARPGLRVPRGWDPFESALRAVLGQQVSVTAARLLAGRLTERAGERVDEPRFPTLTHRFPTPGGVIDADLTAMGMPGARVATLRGVAAASLDDPHLFRRGAGVEETVARLRAIKGVGEWTAQVMAMRACREPDAFPAGDVGLLRGMADTAGIRPKPADLIVRAEVWRPYRAYAAQHIWAADADRIDRRLAPFSKGFHDLGTNGRDAT